MHNNNNNNDDQNTSVPVLHIEELVKRYYNVKSKHGHTHRKKYYDVDWRFYVMHKYGQYVLCGTRCPMYDTYNEKWPVVTVSFLSTRDVFEYIGLLIGSNKVNVTLFTALNDDIDLTFSHPTNERFRALDSERENRRTELVGYDHIRASSPTIGDSKVMQLLKTLSMLNSGNMVPFTLSPHPSLRKVQRERERECVEEMENTKCASVATPADVQPVLETAQPQADCDDAFHYDYYDYSIGDFYTSQ
jgi:hypothetical protein